MKSPDRRVKLTEADVIELLRLSAVRDELTGKKRFPTAYLANHFGISQSRVSQLIGVKRAPKPSSPEDELEPIEQAECFG